MSDHHPNQAITRFIGSLLRVENPPQIDAETAAFTEMLIQTLLPRGMAVILQRRLGLDGPRQTLIKIGENLGIHRERVRQMESKAERILSCNASKAVSMFLQAPAEIRQQMMSLNTAKALFRWMNPSSPSSIEELELSVRGYNAAKGLEALGILRLEDLPLPAEKRVLVQRKIGLKVTREIERILDLYDLRLFAG